MSETIDTDGANAPETSPPTGHIHNMGYVDLRSAKTPDDLKYIASIKNVGCVLVLEHLATALASIPMENVGTVVPVPEGDNIKIQVGQVHLTGESLAAGNPEDILFVVGQMFISTPVASVGYKELWVHGQIMALRGSEGPIGAKLGKLTGQTMYLPAKSRTVMGELSISKAFLEFLPEPEALIIMGELNIEDDVTVELLQSKIPEIVLMGEISTPRHLLALVQVITREKMGEINAR